MKAIEEMTDKEIKMAAYKYTLLEDFLKERSVRLEREGKLFMGEYDSGCQDEGYANSDDGIKMLSLSLASYKMKDMIDKILEGF